MVRRSLLPYPTGDLRAWALQLVEALQQRQEIDSETFPTAVLLARLDGEARAATDGILLYNGDLDQVVVSIGGEWVPLADDRPFLVDASYLDFTPSATYAPVPIGTTNIVPGKDGIYTLTVQGTVIGTGGNAYYQFRFTQGGAVVSEGIEHELGNGETRPVSTTLTASTDNSAGALTLEMRGNNVDFINGSVTGHRIGAL